MPAPSKYWCRTCANCKRCLAKLATVPADKVCPLKPDPDLDVPEVEIEAIGASHHVTWRTSSGSSEYLTPDEAFAFASALMRAADRARKADSK